MDRNLGKLGREAARDEPVYRGGRSLGPFLAQFFFDCLAQFGPWAIRWLSQQADDDGLLPQ